MLVNPFLCGIACLGSDEFVVCLFFFKLIFSLFLKKYNQKNVNQAFFILANFHQVDGMDDMQVLLVDGSMSNLALHCSVKM